MSAIQATDEIFDPFVLIHQSVTARLQTVEAELETAESKSRELEASLDQVRDQAGESRVVEKHLLNNLKQFSPSEVQETFANIRETQLIVERVQLQYEALAARRAELKDQGQFLRSASQILADLQRMYGDNGSHPPPADGDKQFRDASRQVFQIIEEERMRIARDMHDGPAQSMANLVLQAEILERLLDRNPKQLLTELGEFKNSVRNALEEIRQLIFDLRPMTLDDLGLVPTLRKFIKEYGDRYGLATRFNVVGQERRLPGNTEGVLFRIIQEALTNVHKHARAKMAEVTMNLQPSRVSVVIKDDGQGFDVARTEANLHKNKNLGLLSMRERAELEKGTLEIRSQPGRGTEVKVEVPLAKR
ncbi:MAG TPA: sensor histidine kinase [Candidatus Dormibacteraeota bacterium]|nr:sensor histidine kinase [Candidatus Dormibacteraeota bacterium]